MFAKSLVIAGLVIALSGVATAGGEEVLALDLSAAGGSTYFLKCTSAKGETTRSVLECMRVTVWEQTNVVPGLQTSIFASGDRPYDPDTRLLP